jgi:hypothetical protein
MTEVIFTRFDFFAGEQGAEGREREAEGGVAAVEAELAGLLPRAACGVGGAVALVVNPNASSPDRPVRPERNPAASGVHSMNPLFGQKIYRIINCSLELGTKFHQTNCSQKIMILNWSKFLYLNAFNLRFILRYIRLDAFFKFCP